MGLAGEADNVLASIPREEDERGKGRRRKEEGRRWGMGRREKGERKEGGRKGKERREKREVNEGEWGMEEGRWRNGRREM